MTKKYDDQFYSLFKHFLYNMDPSKSVRINRNPYLICKGQEIISTNIPQMGRQKILMSNTRSVAIPWICSDNRPNEIPLYFFNVSPIFSCVKKGVSSSSIPGRVERLQHFVHFVKFGKTLNI